MSTIRESKRAAKRKPSTAVPGFAERLQKALVGHEASEVAKKIGVSRSSFYKWLTGRFEPGLSKLAAFCTITNVSLDWLISGRGEIRPNELPGYVRPNYPLAPSWPPLIFESRWLERNIGPKSLFPLVLIEVPDDAMEPTLRKGDLVLARDYEASRPNGLYLVARSRAEPGEQIIPFRQADNLVGFELDLDHIRPAKPDEDVTSQFVLDSKGHLVQRFFPRRVEWSIKGPAIVKCDNPAYSQVIEITDPIKQGIVVMKRVVWHARPI